MRRVITILLICLSASLVQAQIKIGGSVYGGGNKGNVDGSANVRVRNGDLNKVFGGARMANVGGNTFVNIDGANALGYILINYLYGGNDVAGTIGTARAVGEPLPAVLTGNPDGVDDTWNAYVHISTKEQYTAETAAAHNAALEGALNSTDPLTAEQATAYNDAIAGASKSAGDVLTEKETNAYNAKLPGAVKAGDFAGKEEKCFIGQAFAGGNGDFTYTDEAGNPLKEGDDYVVKEGGTTIALSDQPFSPPVLAKTYLDIQGGTIAFAYGGGNNATVTQSAVIHVDNPSTVVNEIKLNAAGLEAEDGEDVLQDNDRVQKDMGIRMTQEHFGSPEFQIGRLFGGNNKAEMAIRPTWDLQSGKIRNLYSGGNRGKMTSPEGLLLEIDPKVPSGLSYFQELAIKNKLVIDNVYGGCRMADVMPTVNGVYKPCTNLQLKDDQGNLIYKFPDELSARVLVRGGDINNVYGGNDVTGTVYGGNAIGIYSSVRGNVYGGGNGAYSYTDLLEDDPFYGDFYYPTPTGMTSIDALNAYRPNAEQVSIRLKGAGPRERATIIKGSVYVGGNCATLSSSKEKPLVELKIGSHVIANNVFLGNNGERMVDVDNLKLFKGYVDDNGEYTTDTSKKKFSSLDLTDTDRFAKYMDGVVMRLQPRVVFDSKVNKDPDDYEPYSSYVGSFYCGGNVGSMAIAGLNKYEISEGLNIFEKFVGGCNNANVPVKYLDEANKDGQLNAAYEGGVLGIESERGTSGSDFYTDTGAEGGKIKDRLEINLANLTVVPLRWNDTGTGLIWNTNKWYDYVLIEDGTVLAEGDVYYTYNSDTKEYTEHTVGSGGLAADGSTHYKKYQGFLPVPNSPIDEDVRLVGGNVYGGCHNSGHVNGNVVVNINEDLLKRDDVFGDKEDGLYGNKASGVALEDQRDDIMATSMYVYGAGCGKNTEIWGSTTVNLNKGYAFQVFGGGEEGYVGKKNDSGNYVFNPAYSSTVNLKGNAAVYSDDGTVDNLVEAEYLYGGGNYGDVCGNTYVNLGYGRLYAAFGGACNADILGHTEVYVGRQPNSAGSYIDGFPWLIGDGSVCGGNDFGGKIWGGKIWGGLSDGLLSGYEDGYDFTSRVRNYDGVKTMLHGYTQDNVPDVLRSSTYVEYLQGRADAIFGGGYGEYDYDDPMYGGVTMPRQESSYVNFRPNTNTKNSINSIYGGSTGYSGYRNGDKAQDRSYVLIDIPDGVENFKDTQVFGAGSYNGLGMRFDKEKTFHEDFDPDRLSAIIDLVHGKIGTAFGGSYNEGVTARTVINVPAASTINITDIFGGAYGTHILPPCDVYESNVNYNNTSENARVTGAIFGGNNNERRTVYAHVNVTSPVWSNKEKGYLSTIYGAGRGIDTWSEYAEVNLHSGARVYEVYGGGKLGHVLNAESVQRYMQLYADGPSDEISTKDPFWKDTSKWTLTDGKRIPNTDDLKAKWAADWADAWTLGGYYSPVVKDNDGNVTGYDYTGYVNNGATNLTNTAQVTNPSQIDDRDYSGYTDAEKAKRQYLYNTNVRIEEGATVVNYAYGGGWGEAKTPLSGDVYGTTYIALLGGTVKKDIYAAGTSGSVNDIFGVGHYDASTNPNGFTASANAYIKGGSCRNVYGGGWKGSVGHHTGGLTDPYYDFTNNKALDIYGETHVVIGCPEEQIYADSIKNADQKHGFYYGRPTVQRNAYGGGEGGAVYGTAHITMHNGYVGYQFNPAITDNQQTANFDERYEEKIEDETYNLDKDGHFESNSNLYDSGCIFGGGYIDNSNVDITRVKMYGGNVRNSLFGGGEIAAVGRGVISASGANKSVRTLQGIYKAGETGVALYGGHVHRNVFGGGRGYNNLGERGTLYSDGYVFGQTEVDIFGGEVGTLAGLTREYGNVFGGGDIGYVYSAYEKNGLLCVGKKSGVRYDNTDEGYYYECEGGSYVNKVYNGTFRLDDGEKVPTEDCKVLVEPHCKVLSAVTINGHSYTAGQYVPTSDLNYLKNKNLDKSTWACLDSTGIIIHNAVFAGGNTSTGSTTAYANATSVYGNATASIHDVYHRDLITLGTGHIGGLYGDGNLTFVDGYRGLNITNYGTDYYYIKKEIDIKTYKKLSEREAAYYELKYTCQLKCTDKDGTIYNPQVGTSKASTITADDMMVVFLEDKDTSGKVYSVEVDEQGNRVAHGTEGATPILTQNAEGKWIPNPAYWKESGVLPVYAGRLMNSIQRADFCGVFGSRMVMQGARDRVPEVVDFTNYTINRVREVSLNQMHSKITSDLALTAGGTSSDPANEHPDNFVNLNQAIHGNYFGIYNIVNYLGALTSDVHFKTGEDIRRTENTSNPDLYKADITLDGNTYEYGKAGATYYNWKAAHIDDKTRNNGTSLNKVALASGVYLELTTEQSTGDGLYEKDWGYITGVVELDLINVQPGIGGGFVYAKNEHGIPSYSKKTHATLTALNRDAVTRKDFTYDNSNDATKKKWQTSGNFIHSTQTIIDDCYNISAKYKTNYAPPGGVPAHYWFIKGSVYIYDQYISAYTGAPNAYSETVEIPLTITAASHGEMKLLEVQPNLYAYYSSPGVPLTDNKVSISDVSYYKNDPISYWDYYMLSKSEQGLFVDKTYVVVDSCYLGDKFYPEGYVMLPQEYKELRDVAERNNQHLTPNAPAVQKATVNANGEPVVVTDDLSNPIYEAFDFAFRESNNLSHDKGYILTYKVNNPTQWDVWYTEKNDDSDGNGTITTPREKNQTGGTGYENGPTYRLKGTDGEVLGQQEYAEGSLISEDAYYTFEGKSGDPKYPGVRQHTSASNGTQATFDPAYIVTKQFTVTDATGTHHMNPGSTVSKTVADAHDGCALPAYICTGTIQLSTTEFIYVDAKMTAAERQAYIDRFTSSNPALAAEIAANIVPAYCCLTEGNYGGNYYESGKNYRGLEAWSAMSADDREKFTFNYDALDLLIDPRYSRNELGAIIHKEGQKYQYDSAAGTLDGAQANAAHYSLKTPVDYTATYNGTELDLGSTSINVTRYNSTTEKFETKPDNKVLKDDELDREAYESLANEQRHYSPVTPRAEDDYKVYVVNKSFQVGSSPYAAGQTISSSEYESLTEKANVTVLQFTADDENKTFYYCRDSYECGATVNNYANVSGTQGFDANGNTVTISTTGYTSGQTVPVGLVIAGSQYTGLPNQQKNFTIHGISPTEVSTLYVSRNSDIFDLSKEKIITVVYQYDYEEVDASGGVTPVSERHVVNIHLNFKSGIPEVGDIKTPPIVIPGDLLGMREPEVKPGAYEVTGGGWKLFERINDAENHTNGIEYVPDVNPLYWYQHQWYLAYYAKTYLGETYSNHVPVSVANYHDLKKVFEAKEHHYYVDNPDVKRAPKIYINDYSNDAEGSKNGLDLLKNLFDLSVLNSPTLDEDGLITGDATFTGHAPLNQTQVGAGKNLEFFLRTDIDHSSSAWTPIGGSNCFEGTLHGDGHHLSGLSNSLFGRLCGDVYNLGVSGTFTGAGIAEEGDGFMENCWVSTSATGTKTSKPLFGNPSRLEGDAKGLIQMVNCYYEEEDDATNKFPVHSGTHGMPTRKPHKAFYDGEVAYDLNGFYLYKRYCDNVGTSSLGSITATYNYWKPGLTDPQTGYYDTVDGTLCSSGSNGNVKYVEDRYQYEDFIYADGEIPETVDPRLHVDAEGKSAYYPIWPDDYIFFGQKLTYGWAPENHDEKPTAVVRDDGLLSLEDDANRVYRAPAYFRSKEMGVAHFNPNAYLAQTKKNDSSVKAYPGMTAIDFADHRFGSYETYKSYEKGLNNGWFYQPLLDDDGLTGIVNCDETQNLLVYAPAASAESGYANAQTHSVLTSYFTEPAYSDYYDNSKEYRLVREYPDVVNGHLVQSNLKAVNDHLLMDRQDFNAPLQYSFDSSHLMWYQRTPSDKEFVDYVWSGDPATRSTKGWQGISIPFTAELVTTNQKGEITHFYNGSQESANSTRSKIGHEYWLREFNAIKEEGTDPDVVAKADFFYPSATGETMTKSVTNRFLWDYYYQNTSVHNRKDENRDIYQTYYERTRTYSGYRLLTAATPYILGLPSKTFYEFDLSGNFKAQNTYADIPKLDRQVITFASNKGATIHVSDDEMAGVVKKHGGKDYTFKPNYLNVNFDAGTSNYVLDADGDSYDKVPGSGGATQLSAFRPYFTATTSAGTSRPDTRSIVFSGGEGTIMPNEGQSSRDNDGPGTLNVTTERHKILVTSELKVTTTVSIVNTAGITIATFDIVPGQTVETRVKIAGVYIVLTTDGFFNKKLTVK